MGRAIRGCVKAVFEGFGGKGGETVQSVGIVADLDRFLVGWYLLIGSEVLRLEAFSQSAGRRSVGWGKVL